MSPHEETYHIEPGQPWEVDLFRPEDAEGIRRLFLSIYGTGYPITLYLDPQRLIEENAAGRTISSVARTPRGEVVGHNSLFNSAPYPRLYEEGAGLVHADYRGGKGIFLATARLLQEVAAQKYGVEAIFGESVCNHVFSQRLCHTLGWATQAVEVDLMPAAAYAQEKSASGRVASLFDFRTLIPNPQTVYIPPVYADALQFIYEGLDDERILRPADQDLPFHETATIASRVFDFAQVARVALHNAGPDLAAAFSSEEDTLIRKGFVVIQVAVPLSWPWIHQVVDMLRPRGYFLGGILPRWLDNDALLMQKIHKVPDWDTIQIQFDRAKELLGLVKHDWAEAQARTYS